MTAIRLGIVGLGWGVRVAEAARRVEEVKIVACHARTAATREAFAARFGSRAYGSYEAMLADDSLHGIVIMTPNTAHRTLAIAALRAGKHVLVTKPLAATLADAAAIIAAAREADRILAVGHQSRRHPALRELRKLITTGELGRPLAIEGNTSSPTGLTVATDDWRARVDECPGGPLMQIGIHFVDNFQYLLGPVRSVWSLHAKLGGGAVDPDTTVTVLTFDHGAPGYLGSSYVSPYTRWIRMAGERGCATFEGDGSLVLQRSDGMRATVVPPQAGSREEILQGLLAGEISEFADCIRTGRAPEIDGAQGLRNLAVVLAAVESARRGAVVVLEEMLHVHSVE